MRSVADIRRINERRTLATLFRDGPDSRAALARRLCVTRSTAGILVNTLLDARLAREEQTRGGEDEKTRQPERARVGRPGTIIALRPDGATFLGAEIGVDQLTVVSLDLAAKTVHREHVLHEGRSTSPETTIARLAALLRDLQARAPERESPVGVSVTVPGFVDATGACHAANLGWRGVPVGALLGKELGPGLPFLLENDANASAVAELYAAVASGSPELRDTVVVLIEDGVGAGILQGGRLHRGRRHGAGEIGHMPINPAPERATGGARPRNDRFEAQVGRAATLDLWHRRGGSGDTDALIAGCTAGDAIALGVAHDWAAALARGLACVTCTLEPQAFVVGGSVGKLAVFALDTLNSELNAYLPPGYPSPTIEPSRLDGNGCATGAACLLHARFLEDRSVSDADTAP